MSTEDDLFGKIWELYIEPVKPRIRARASDIAKADDRSEVTASDVFEALKEFVPGKPVPHLPLAPSVPEAPQSWFNRNITGFIAITGGLAIIFGILGLVPFFVPNLNEKYVPIANSFLEIAKLCAGVLVGGAGAAGAVAISGSPKKAT